MKTPKDAYTGNPKINGGFCAGFPPSDTYTRLYTDTSMGLTPNQAAWLQRQLLKK